MKSTQTCATLNVAQESFVVRARGTTTELRFIASYLDCHFAQTKSIPQSAGLQTLEEILPPSILASLPKSDLWGRPYRYRSAGGTYLLVSLGANGAPEYSYEILELELDALRAKIPPERNSQESDDIVIADGHTLRWYE